MQLICSAPGGADVNFPHALHQVELQCETAVNLFAPDLVVRNTVDCLHNGTDES